MAYNSPQIDSIPVLSVGGEALECGEASVKVGDDDLRLVPSKSGEKTFFSSDQLLPSSFGGNESGQ